MDDVTGFLTTHARLLDRRRYDLLAGTGTPQAALTALAAYRNADGGYGSGLEPDLRSSTSQPVTALHAFQVFEEAQDQRSPDAVALCDWLETVTLPDGGLPFGLPLPDPVGTAPFFAQVDPGESSLHMTSMLAAAAHRVGRHDDGVRGHAWLRRATDYSMRRIRALTEAGHALELLFVLHLLDAVHDTVPDAPAELRRVGAFLPASGVVPVGGGAPDEAIRTLDIAPEPGRPVRELFSASAVDADLDRLESEQQDDGGWVVDFRSYSAAAALEWRGYATVGAVRVLRANGRR